MLLIQLPHCVREQAANTMYLEAQCRIQDPVYGCVGIISKLYQQIHDAEIELAKIQTQITCHKLQNQQYEAKSNLSSLPPQSINMEMENFQWLSQDLNYSN
ncbi:hypothetical protein TSUD_24490 [Trifolium subterraneum]|uniref:LOB domain-containing protein n=1 Tax=Trifolium subterraneum TaxID=3900 RepID=A0A2Z6NQT8_TRISU|nr:hypothetical protein TSUD_24490 [Trifolium subterraneum]